MSDRNAPITDAERAELDARLKRFLSGSETLVAKTRDVQPNIESSRDEGVPLLDTGEGLGAVGPAWSPTRETVQAYYSGGQHPRFAEAVEAVSKFYQMGGRLSGPAFTNDFPAGGFGLVRVGIEGDRPEGSDAEQREPRGIDAANDLMAMPANPDAYDVRLARDGFDRLNADLQRVGQQPDTWDKDMEVTLCESAFAIGLGQAQVTGVAGIVSEALRDPRYVERTTRDAQEQLRNPAFQAVLAEAQAVVKVLPNSARVVEFLEKTGLGNDTRVIRLLAEQSSRIRKGKILQRVPRMPGQRGVAYRSAPDRRTV